MTHIVSLPDNKQGTGRAVEGPAENFLTSVLGKHSVQQISFGRLTSLVDIGKHNGSALAPAAFAGQPTTASLLIQGAHQAYAAHLGLGLRPEVFWYAVVSEVSEHIRQHPGLYRELLGPDWIHGPRTIHAHVGDHSSLYQRFYDQLADALGQQLGELFAPPLSTVDTDERIALIAAFMEAAGPYHNYQAPAQCKIPHIEIEGTADDWQLLRQNAERLSELFPPLENYLEVVSIILHNIHCTIAGLEINLGNFWEKLYEWNDDPAGPFARGWITSLFAHRRVPTGKPVLRNDPTWWNRGWDGLQVGQFASHVTSVPISAVGARGSRNPMQQLIAGVLGIKLTKTDGLQVLTPRLGWGVVKFS